MLPTLAALALSALVQDVTPQPLPPRSEQPPGVVAVTNARIYPVTSAPIESGTMLVEGGKILRIGDDVEIPRGATVIDAGSMSMMPGLVESHSHMALKQLWQPTTGSYNNELSQPINAGLRAIDGLNTRDLAFRIALEAGITTMNITPGSRSPNSGQAVVVKLRGGSVGEMFLAHGGMKFAMRIQRRSPFGITIQESRELIRQDLIAAQEYLREWARYDSGEADTPPTRNLKLEAFGKLLTREWPVGVHAHGEEPMRLAISLKDEFNLRLSIHHADATYLLAEELAEKGIPVSWGPILPFVGREDPGIEGPVRLAQLGGAVSFHQDHPDGPQYYLREGASLFVRKGMSEQDALKALTTNPASLFGLDDRIGSLEPGMDADFILLDGPPLAIESRVQRVFIEGVEVFRREGELRRSSRNAGAAGLRPANDRTGAVRRVAAPAAGGTLAVLGGRIETVSGDAIENGTVLIRNGRIVEVGTAVVVPDDAAVLDASGMTVTPGFVDARTGIGVPPQVRDDRDMLIRSDFTMSEHLGPLFVPGAFGQGVQRPAVHPWLRGGVTAVYVSPGSQNLVGGFGAVAKLMPGALGEVLNDAAGLSISFGDAAQRAFEAPTTRQGMVGELRQWLIDNRAAQASDAVASLRLTRVLSGDIPIRAVANTPDDILTAVRIAQEFDLRLVVDVGAGAHVVAETLADGGVPVVVGPSMLGAGGGGSLEMFAHTAENAARLHRAGVTLALSTDALLGRSVVTEAVVARAHGLDPKAALQAVTLDAARILGVDDRIGSIEPGKDADLVLWDGDPVGTWGEARVVIVSGEVVFQRSP